MTKEKDYGLEKYYTVFASLNNNLSPVIKSFFSQRSSLAMSAYISDVPRVGDKVYQPKESRDAGEVNYIGLILPETTPGDILKEIIGEEEIQLTRVREYYPYLDSSDKVGDCYLIKDPNVISRFWVLNDEHIKKLAKQYGKLEGSKGKPNVRLYYTNVLALPAAEKHFPSGMGLKRKDLVEVTQRAILELYYDTYLKDGYVVELSRHKNKQDIDHVHALMPAMRLKFSSIKNKPEFRESDFIAWLSRNQEWPLRERIKKHEKKVEYWEKQKEKYPSSKNEDTLKKWKESVQDTRNEYEEVRQIIARKKADGSVWEKYRNKFNEIQLNRYLNDKKDDSIFSKYKNNVEVYHDSKDFLYKFKLHFADLLNKYLAQAKIIHSGRRLFGTHKPIQMFISTKEAIEYGVEEKVFKEINRLINSLRKFDDDNYFYNPTNKLGTKQDRKRLIVHVLRRKYMRSFDQNRKAIATSLDRAKEWVDKWKYNLMKARDQYEEMVKSFIDISIYDMSWKPSKVDSTMFVVDEKITSYKPVLKRLEGKEVVVVNESHGAYLGQDQGLNAYSVDALKQLEKPQQNREVIDSPVEDLKSLIDYFYEELRSLKLWLDKSDGYYKVILPEGERHLTEDEFTQILLVAKSEETSFVDAYDMFFEKQYYKDFQL